MLLNRFCSAVAAQSLSLPLLLRDLCLARRVGTWSWMPSLAPSWIRSIFRPQLGQAMVRGEELSFLFLNLNASFSLIFLGGPLRK